jgi:putative FmdB family regulatory protein
MPTYEYACDKCGRSFETTQSILDKPLTVCPKELCRQKKWGRGKVKRAICAGAGLLFKGNGFYITDYRSEGYKKSAQSESSAPAAPAAPAASTTTPAPAAASTGAGKSESAAPAPKPAKAKADKS